MNDINIIKKNKEPKYVTIYNILFKMINEGKFAENDRLPSEPDLAKDLGVSRTTLRQALTLLQDDGLIKIVRGKGNFITKDKFNKDPIASNAIQNPIFKYLNQSNEIDHIEMEFHLETCTDYFHKVLGTRPAAVVVIDRWYKTENKTVAYSFTIVPIEYISKYDIDLNNHDDLLKFVEKDIYDICDNVTLDIKFSTSGNFAAKKYHFTNKEHFFLLEENVCLKDNAIIAFSKFYLPVDTTSIRIHLKK